MCHGLNVLDVGTVPRGTQHCAQPQSRSAVDRRPTKTPARRSPSPIMVCSPGSIGVGACAVADPPSRIEHDRSDGNGRRRDLEQTARAAARGSRERLGIRSRVAHRRRERRAARRVGLRRDRTEGSRSRSRPSPAPHRSTRPTSSIRRTSARTVFVTVYRSPSAASGPFGAVLHLRRDVVVHRRELIARQAERSKRVEDRLLPTRVVRAAAAAVAARLCTPIKIVARSGVTRASPVPVVDDLRRHGCRRPARQTASRARSRRRMTAREQRSVTHDESPRSMVSMIADAAKPVLDIK